MVEDHSGFQAPIIIVKDGAGNYLQVPTLTTAERNALAPVNGMIIYNSTTALLEEYEAGAWVSVSAPSAHAGTHEPAGADEVNDIDIGNTGVLLSAHEARHVSGGTDEIDSALALAAIPTHGAAEHTDVTRELFIPNGNDTDGWFVTVGSYDVVALEDANDWNLSFTFKVPDDFVSFGSLKVVWFGEVGGVAGQDWVCDPTANYASAGEAIDTHSDAPANTTIDVTALTTTYETDVGFTLANLAKGDYVGVTIFRLGTDVADTYTAATDVLGLLLTYTAEQ